MRKFSLLMLVLSTLVLGACGNILVPDDASSLDSSSVPAAPQADSRNFGNGGDWLQQARKDYLSVFFGFVEYEKPVAAAFFGPGATLEVTSYQPGAVPLSGSYTGTASVLGYFKNLFKAIDIRDLSIQYQLAEGDYVSSHIRLSFTGKKTGKKAEMELVYLFRFDPRTGCISSARIYYDTQVWTRALTPGGPSSLSDTRDPTDNHKIGTTSYDVENLVKTVYDKFYAGDIPSVLTMMSPKVAVYFKGDKTTYPYAGVYKEIPGLLQFIQDLAGTAVPYNIVRFQVTEGDRTDVILFEEWTVFATGKSYHVHTVNSWKVARDGLLLGFSNYPDSLEIAKAYVP
jgi:ketosteroid isomerase-like protein